MSKTKGNVVDPLAVIDETGADALRFALIHGAAAGQDQRFGRTKLENARTSRTSCGTRRGSWSARPATIPAGAERRLPLDGDLGPAERWTLSRASGDRRGGRCRHGGLRVRRGHAALYDAIWNEFCDWGVELAKVRLADASLPGHPRGDLVGARPGAGHLSAPPPPGDALRDGAAVGARSRTGPAIRGCSSWRAGRPRPVATSASKQRSTPSSSWSAVCATLAPRRGSRRPPGCRPRSSCRCPWDRRSRRSGRPSSGSLGRAPWSGA